MNTDQNEVIKIKLIKFIKKYIIKECLTKIKTNRDNLKINHI